MKYTLFYRFQFLAEKFKGISLNSSMFHFQVVPHFFFVHFFVAYLVAIRGAYDIRYIAEMSFSCFVYFNLEIIRDEFYASHSNTQLKSSWATETNKIDEEQFNSMEHAKGHEERKKKYTKRKLNIYTRYLIVLSCYHQKCHRMLKREQPTHDRKFTRPNSGLGERRRIWMPKK